MGLVLGSDGNLYGSTGAPPGTVFQLALSGGAWTENVIYTVSRHSQNAVLRPIMIDANLDIYLPALFSPCGDLYKLTPMSGNIWKSSQLYSFNPDGADGCAPNAAVAIGKWGALYGTTTSGGPDNDGVVFAVAP
jgi:hypothetical protein